MPWRLFERVCDIKGDLQSSADEQDSVSSFSAKSGTNLPPPKGWEVCMAWAGYEPITLIGGTWEAAATVPTALPHGLRALPA